jgi:hypothetical protein
VNTLHDMGWFDGDPDAVATEAWNITSRLHDTQEKDYDHRFVPPALPPQETTATTTQATPPMAPPATPPKNAIIHEAIRAGVGIILLVAALACTDVITDTRLRHVEQSKQLGKQPDDRRRYRAAEEMRGPPSGRAQKGRRQPPDEVNGLRNYVVASYGRFLGIALDARGPRPKRLRSRACLLSISEQEQLVAGPISPPAVSPHKREVSFWRRSRVVRVRLLGYPPILV